MILKKVLFAILFFSLTNLYAQSNTNFMVVNQSGQTFEVNISTCTVTHLSNCSGGFINSIAMINSIVYFSNGSKLYRYPYNTTGTCEYLQTFPSSGGITSLTSGPNGLIYAAAGSTIFSYDPATNIALNLGTIPSQWQSSGDLIFYENELLLTTVNEELIKIDLNNLSNSQTILIFPANTSVYGLSTVSNACSTNLVFGLNTISSGTTQLLPLDLVNNVVGGASCTLPFRVYDAASLSENGSTNQINPTFTPVGPICIGGTASPLPTTSTNGITGTWSPAINNSVTTTYTFTPMLGSCANPVTMTIAVNPIVAPIFTPVPSICSGDTILPLPTTSDNGISGTWSPALNNAATTTYTFTPTNGVCASPATLSIGVIPGIAPIFTPIAAICSGDTNLQLPSVSNNGIRGTWLPAINNIATTTYNFIPTGSMCIAPTTLTVSVILPINVTLNTTDLCIDPDTQLPKYQAFLTTNLSQPNYVYNWYFNGNLITGAHSNDLLIHQTGSYFVEITDTATSCITKSNSVSVNQIDVLDEFTIEVSGEFTDHASILVTPASPALFYQIDTLPFQNSNVFEGVSYGFHSIAVKDSILCTDFNGMVFVPGYPKYFTPNGDGYHDTWNVFGFNATDTHKVYIYDRYGKFIHEIDNTSAGWDGKLNGKELPSTDYWFVVNYYLNNQSKTFKGHFSLKR